QLLRLLARPLDRLLLGLVRRLDTTRPLALLALLRLGVAPRVELARRDLAGALARLALGFLLAAVVRLEPVEPFGEPLQLVRRPPPPRRRAPRPRPSRRTALPPRGTRRRPRSRCPSRRRSGRRRRTPTRCPRAGPRRPRSRRRPSTASPSGRPDTSLDGHLFR